MDMDIDIPSINLHSIQEGSGDVPEIKLSTYEDKDFSYDMRSPSRYSADFLRSVRWVSVVEESFVPKLEELKHIHWSSFNELVKGLNVYSGERDDHFRPHGYGTQQYANGDVYIGKFENGVKSGQGSYAFYDGSDYAGEWVDGRRYGRGTMRYSDGSRYSGEWDNDLKHGWGKYEFANGDIYEGLFEKDCMHGYCGIYTFAKPNYLYYVGPFKDNKIHWKDCVKLGHGKLYASNKIATVERMIYADKHRNYSAQTAVEDFLEEMNDEDEDFIKLNEYVTDASSLLKNSLKM